MLDMTRLSVAIIAKNREKEIETCLKSVRGVDEIILLDTGSHDKTPAVAIANRATVYYYKWDDDFAAARNRALDYVTSPWVLSIDSDEVLLTPVEKVYDFIGRNFSKKVIGVHITQKDYDFYGPRLFRKNGIHWMRPVHEVLSVPADMITDDIVIEHRPSKDHASDPGRNIAILRKILHKDPLSSVDAFYMADELINTGQYDAAMYWIRLYIELTPKTMNFTSEAYYMMHECYLKLNRVGKAIDSLVKAITVNPEFKTAYEQLYVLTKNDAWAVKASKATNYNVLKLR